MCLIAVCVFFVAIKISFWTKFKTYLRKYQTVPVNNTDGGTTTTSVVCKQYLVELYLGSTFGSCFGEGYRSTCFGHRYRSKRTEDKKKNFFLKLQQPGMEGDRCEQKEQPSLRQHLTMWT